MRVTNKNKENIYTCINLLESSVSIQDQVYIIKNSRAYIDLLCDDAAVLPNFLTFSKPCKGDNFQRKINHMLLNRPTFTLPSNVNIVSVMTPLGSMGLRGLDKIKQLNW
jgi:hypothetical protein